MVRLFRLGLGRDPDPVELVGYADRLRTGGSVADIAALLAGTDEFRSVHGPERGADADFVRTVWSHVCGAEDPAGEAAANALAQGRSRAGLMAALIAWPQLQSRLPLLPGLAPGASAGDDTAYAVWIAAYDTPGQAALQSLPQIGGPVLSLVVAVGDTEPEAAARTVRSLQHQVYQGWELVVAARPLSPWPKKVLAQVVNADERIRIVDGARGANTAVLLAEALRHTNGAMVGMLVPGDELSPTALYEAVLALQSQPQTLLLFTDEDSLRDGVRTAPRFKPAWSPDAMQAGNTIGQLALFDRALLEDAGGLQPNAWPNHVDDLTIRAAAKAGMAAVHHLPAMVFHRQARAAVAVPRSSSAAGLEGQALHQPSPMPTGSLPLVSVIVPTRNHADLLARCADGVLNGTDYAPLELLIVDNGSDQPNAVALLAELAADARVRIVHRPDRFNFAALNNAAAVDARGELLVLLNNDVEILDPAWLTTLVRHAVRPDIGIVGAKLLYPDNTVQHAGILLGPDGAATHVGRGAPADDPGYLGQLSCTRDLCAVTGACLAIRAATWKMVDGMDERLAIAWNDIDLCLRVRQAGLRVIWTPDVVLLHRESASRGLEAADPAELARFRQEQTLVRARWGAAVDADPFLNANLLAEPSGHLCLTKPRGSRPWDADEMRSSVLPQATWQAV